MTVDQGRLWNIHMGDLFRANWISISKNVLVLPTTKACKENPTKYDEVVPLAGFDFTDKQEEEVLKLTTL